VEGRGSEIRTANQARKKRNGGNCRPTKRGGATPWAEGLCSIKHSKGLRGWMSVVWMKLGVVGTQKEE